MKNKPDVEYPPHVAVVAKTLRDEAPYLAGVIQKQAAFFGPNWLKEFERDLQKFFGADADALANATRGYIKFALDGMLLQKRFDKTGRYEAKSYDQAAAEVYQNQDYMFRLYLPGIYLSHFLWRHHYVQHTYFIESFLPLVNAHGGELFFDIGVGTGFYSREMLRLVPGIHGQGFDMSPFSLEYTRRMVDAFGFSARYSCGLRDIIDDPPQEQAPFILNVEVLEHLEDPLTFLKGLYGMLQTGGYGFITAAITAPNADHIYLYNSAGEVAAQVEQAGFDVVEYREDPAYEAPKPNESVPKNAVVIVRK